MEITRNETGKNKWIEYGFLVVLAFLGVAVFSMSSPLYPFNSWDDTHCFITVGRGILNGLLPYRDMIEQKGPLLYAAYALAMWVFPRSFLGVYLLECISMAAFLIISLKTVRLFRNDGPVLLTAVVMALLSSYLFRKGGSAEELCAPLFAYAMYTLLRYCVTGDEVSNKCLFGNGFAAGCIFFVKFTMLGIHFVWMAFLAIDCLVKRRGVLRALKMCLIFLAGMLLSAVPWLIWFGANGALGDLVRGYLTENLTGYGKMRSVKEIIKNIVMGLYRNVRNAVPLVAVVVIGIGYTFFRGNGRVKLALFLLPAFNTVFIFIGGRAYPYYAYTYACFAPLLVLPLEALIQKLCADRKALRIVLRTAVCACSIAAALLMSNNVPRIGYPREKIAQYRVAEEMSKTENPTMLNYRSLDFGVYFTSDSVPVTPWFCKLRRNTSACEKEQNRVLNEGLVDYVVTRKEPLPDEFLDRYELQMSCMDEYDPDKYGYMFYLYRKIGG